MAEASIPVDLFNPGQVFACLGFLEAADVLLGDAEGGFDWSEESNVRFFVRARGEEDPVCRVLRFLESADVESIAPFGSNNGTEKWGVRTERLEPDSGFPCPDPNSPATLPARLVSGEESCRLTIDHWCEDRPRTGRDGVKFWAGSGGYPGAAIVRDALDLVHGRSAESAHAPFGLSALQSSSLRLDWRRDYIPIDAGFSLNRHSKMTAVGFPLVEVLAALGLTNARPMRVHRLEYRYQVLGRRDGQNLLGGASTYPPVLLRAGLGCAEVPFPRRVFRMSLSWPGQEGQARAITTVNEEKYA